MNTLAKLTSGRRLKKTDEVLVESDDDIKLIKAQSFSDLLNIRQSFGGGIFLFNDAKTLGFAAKITPVSLEATSKEHKDEVFKKLYIALNNSIPQEYKDLYLSQTFVRKSEVDIDAVMNKIKSHVSDKCINSEYTENWLEIMRQHLIDISNPAGVFVDYKNNIPWKLSQLDIIVCFYQEIDYTKTKSNLDDNIKHIVAISDSLTQALRQASVQVQTLEKEDYINFIAKFFHNETVHYKSSNLSILEENISRIALNKATISAQKHGWNFKLYDNEYYNTFLTLEDITGDFNLGHLTVESESDGATILDKLPSNCTWSQTLIHTHKDIITKDLDRIASLSIGVSDEVLNNKSHINACKEKMADGSTIIRLAAGIFIQTTNIKDIETQIRNMRSILQVNQLSLLDTSNNPIIKTDFISNLPFNFSHDEDKKFYKKRAVLEYLSEAVKLSPFCGRSQGTGSAGLVNFNRGGELLLFDPLADRMKNAFGLIFGPMGSGKSAYLVYFLMQMLAVYRPRVFIIEKGDSFGLLLEHCKSLGLTTHRVAIQANSKDINLPPFANATKLLAKSTDDDRDLLGEMLITAELMITGGEANEKSRFFKEDKTKLSEAILLAAKNTIKANRKITLTEDVIKALESMSQDKYLVKKAPREVERLRQMSSAMKTFIASNLDKRLFNTAGELFPEVDITQLDVGILGNSGYEDKLAVAFISLMNNINNLVEAKQFEHRPTLILVDEAHLITTNPLLAPYIIKIAKMWRKLGAWLWLATQSLHDYKEESKQMLLVMEWWICLSINKGEVSEVGKFRKLTKEQEILLESASKSSGQYTEGVVLSDKIDVLFRNVPPALSLALAMTEKDEKSQRQKIMQEDNCSELEAVYKVAQKISDNRSKR